MQTNAVNAAGTVAQTTTTDRGMDALKSEDFFKILVTELQQQDPLNPSETADMISQVSQIRSIELSKNLTDALTQLSEQQRTTGTTELLGKHVTATLESEDGTEQEVSGIVTGVRFASDGTAVLELDTGATVRAADVTRVVSPDVLDALASAADADASDESAEDSDDKSDTTQKTAAQSKRKSGGVIPWLSLDGTIQV